MTNDSFLNYKRLLYAVLPDNLKEEVNDPDEYSDYGNSEFLEETLDFFNPSTDYENRHEPYVKDEQDIGRNDPCPCGSGKKFKKCCLAIN